MLVLDDTIANIALPSIQREMAVSAATLPWIINAYILAFGGLLLFGGRVGDLIGDAGCSVWASACSRSPRCSAVWG
jgi:MFS family permease